MKTIYTVQSLTPYRVEITNELEAKATRAAQIVTEIRAEDEIFEPMIFMQVADSGARDRGETHHDAEYALRIGPRTEWDWPEELQNDPVEPQIKIELGFEGMTGWEVITGFRDVRTLPVVWFDELATEQFVDGEFLTAYKDRDLIESVVLPEHRHALVLAAADYARG